MRYVLVPRSDCRRTSFWRICKNRESIAKPPSSIFLSSNRKLTFGNDEMSVTDLASTVESPATEPCTADKGVLEDAFARYQSELLGTLYYFVGNMEDARDAFQETFVKCWRHREEVREIHNLKAWIFRIALNAGRDIRTTAWRRRRQPMSSEEATIATTTTPAEELEQNEKLASLRRALRELRNEEQEVFLLRQNGEMTYEEIGEVIGIPTGTVKTRMRLALSKLRRVLAD